MAENSLELRLQCLELASRSHAPADAIPGLAAQFLAFALHDSPERAEYQHKLDVLARAIHDLAHIIRHEGDETRKELQAMSAATDRLTASVAANTTATDAAVAAFEAGSTSPALEATINAQSDIVDANTAKLTAATPPPVTP